MIIVLNGSQEELSGSATLAEIVERLTSASTGIAVSVDDEVVPRSFWDVTKLVDGARVEVLTAVQGG
jgi:sulfur carrier protein